MQYCKRKIRKVPEMKKDLLSKTDRTFDAILHFSSFFFSPAYLLNKFILFEKETGRKMSGEIDRLKQKVPLLEYIQSRGHNPKKEGNTYRINPCPICQGQSHFTIYPETNSFNSFNECCKGGDIIEYFIQVEGLSMKEAMKKLEELAGASPSGGITQGEGKTEFKLSSSSGGNNGKSYTIEQIQKFSNFKDCYVYLNEQGEQHLLKVRWEKPGEKKTFSQYNYQSGKWVKGYGDKKKVFYNFPELLQAIKDGQTIFFTEGEKDCKTLQERTGKPVTTLMNGCQDKTEDYDFSIFKGAKVRFCGDNDEPGQKYKDNICKALAGAGARVKVLSIPLKKDVTDFFEAGYENIFKDVLKAAKEFTSSSPGQGQLPEKKKKTLLDYCLKPGDLDMPETWLIKDILAYEAIYLFYCKSGGGKSYFTQIVSLFANEEKRVNSVIYLDRDNGKQALRVRQMEKIVTGRKNYYYVPSFHFDKDFQNIFFEELRSGKYGNCLIVIDSLRNFMNGKDPNTDKDSVKFMSEMQELRDLGHTIIILHHVNKTGAIKNNTSFQDFSDEVFEIIPTKDEENDRLFLEFIKRKERIGGITKFVATINCKEMEMIVNEGGISPEDTDKVKNIQEIIKEEHTANQDQIWKLAKELYGYSHKGEIQYILHKYKNVCWKCQNGPKNSLLYSLKDDHEHKNILLYKLNNNNLKTLGKQVNTVIPTVSNWSASGKQGKHSDSNDFDKTEESENQENGMNTLFTSLPDDDSQENGMNTLFTSLPDISLVNRNEDEESNLLTELNNVQPVEPEEIDKFIPVNCKNCLYRSPITDSNRKVIDYMCDQDKEIKSEPHICPEFEPEEVKT